MKHSLAVILFFASGLILAQSSKEIELQLAGHLDRMNYHKYQSHNSDSVTIENTRFKDLLIKYLFDDSSTITKSFDTLIKSGLLIASSSDAMLRIYSWDTQSGGTMRFYDNVFQYWCGDKMCIRVTYDENGFGDPKSWYSEIYTMDDGAEKYYLGVYNADYSTMEKAQGINFFSIKGEALNDVDLAKTNEGLASGLGTNYNFFSIPDNEERPFKIVKYDSNKKTITVPIFTENGGVTGKSTVYKYRRGYFEEVK